ncbi:methylmalonyl-CoA mutase cobalamin-binding subunit [Rhodoligotrophos appendicifer]|uniref:cobalamin-dependent protein n=1 Tax=Rhodoligotrophos appendicifer TaxID=987056 RepID=UPI00117C2570|nr:cobalamin-dependent protein [Rhodoligotrophos appendicifer]
MLRRLDEDLLATDMPSGGELLAEGRAIAAGVEVGTSLLCREFGVRNEAEYKARMTAEGRVMTCMNLGCPTWAATRSGLLHICEQAAKRGFRIDRFTFQMDRRMGIPPQLWDAASKETGPLLLTDAEWEQTASTVPIQPGLADMMIGSPMSVPNCVRALRAGVNYIGNMSQFSWNYPVWDGTDLDQMGEMVKALGIMGAKVDQGAVVQSYLDDGYCAQFSDYSSYIGWALFERYLVEDLVGGHLSVSWGGLTHDPLMKSAVTHALEAVKPKGRFHGFYHCDTTHFTKDVERNYAALSIDMLYQVLTELRLGTGSAVLPIPVTEALRVPTLDETVEVHNITRRIIDDAPRLMPMVNWGPIEAQRDRLIHHGREFFSNLLAGLSGLGVDVTDVLQLLLAVRRLGAVRIERMFGAGARPEIGPLHYEPILPTDTHRDYLERRDTIETRIRTSGAVILRPMKVLVGSTDIHEFGMHLVMTTLQAMGLQPISAGVDLDPDELAEMAAKVNATVVAISTHNGMALSYARQLLTELKARGVDARIIMGGKLNQDADDQPVPVDVSSDLRRLGISVCEDIEDLQGALQGIV